MAEGDTAYYDDRLSGLRLRRCYEIASPRIRQYLDAELEHVRARIRPTDTVLELGCGYGRAVERLATAARVVIGIDTSLPSLQLARQSLTRPAGCGYVAMNAAALGFADACFDVVVCIQNGISAFHVDRRTLILETVRVAKPGGTVLLSSYASQIWDARIEWFEAQAAHGLIGAIDPARTRDGVIVCKDGFEASTVDGEEFVRLCAGLGLEPQIVVVDNSSLFCELRVGRAR